MGTSLNKQDLRSINNIYSNNISRSIYSPMMNKELFPVSQERKILLNSFEEPETQVA